MSKPLESLLRELNSEQLEAVHKTEGPVLVVAGAGSGKTRVLVSRIAYLAAQRLCKAEEIAAITFTQKAAREMRERLRPVMGKAARGVLASTFHALGLRLLREQHQALGLSPDFAVLGESESLSLLLTLTKKHFPKNLKFEIEDLKAQIGRLKEKGIPPEEAPADTPFGTRLSRIYQAYEKAKLLADAVDFDDLQQRPLELLRGKPEFRRACQERWHYFLVDEFQDTNSAQLEMLRLLVDERQNVFAVGDDDQGIYGWRGAELQNLLGFEAFFRKPAILKLQENYRSTRTIIEASNAVIRRNSLRRDKTVFTKQEEGEKIRHHLADDEKDEMDWLLSELKREKAEGRPWSDLAVLVRTNLQMQDFMDEMRAQGIPFAVKGPQNLVELSEVQAVLAYAKAMHNPFDELALKKVLRFPARGFPKDLLDRIARGEESTLESLLRHCGDSGEPWAPEALRVLGALKDRAEEAKGKPFAPSFEALLRETGVLDTFAEGERKRRNVEQFLELLKEEEAYNPGARFAELLGFLALETQFSSDREDRPAVKLMTVHAAKGLEFDTVYLPQLDDDIFPSRNNQTHTGIEEERRLFYVALTRAKRRLVLSFSRTKLRYRVNRDVTPSRFLHEIPAEYLDGPLGRKAEENKQVFLTDFFAQIRGALDGEEPRELFG